MAPTTPAAASVTVTCKLLHRVRPASRASANALAVRIEARGEPRGRTVPVHVAIALDCSGSMDGVARSAAIEGILRLAQGLGRDDRLAVVAFADRASTVIPLSLVPCRERLADALRRAACAGGTCLRSGLEAAAEQLCRAPAGASQGHVAVVSDAPPPRRGPALAELANAIAALRTRGTPVHAVGLGPNVDYVTLVDLAMLTGGELRSIDDAIDLSEALHDLGASVAGAVSGPVSVDATPLARNAVRAALGAGSAVLPQLGRGEAREVLLELEHEPRPQGTYVAASVGVRALLLESGESTATILEPEVAFTGTDAAAEFDQSVARARLAADAARAARELLEGLQAGALAMRDAVAAMEGVASLLRAAELPSLADSLPIPTKARRWEGWRPNNALARIVHLVASGKAAYAPDSGGCGPRPAQEVSG